MDSHPEIGGEPSKRKTRSWHPASQDRATRETTPRSRPKDSNGRSGLGTEARYWGRVNTLGEFEQASSFPAPPYQFRFPWRLLFATLRRILPLAASAFVGAVTALAWQSFLIGPTTNPGGRLIPPIPAARSMTAVPLKMAVERPPADMPIIHESARPPVAPATALPVVQGGLGAAPSLSTTQAPSASERPQAGRPSGNRAVVAKPRSPAAHANANRAPRPSASPTRAWQPLDSDGVLRPSFL